MHEKHIVIRFGKKKFVISMSEHGIAETMTDKIGTGNLVFSTSSTINCDDTNNSTNLTIGLVATMLTTWFLSDIIRPGPADASGAVGVGILALTVGICTFGVCKIVSL